ncbi:MAG: fibronectin type III domain-containing protein [Flavobacterium sp.]
MKKITLWLFLLIFPLLSFAQTEGFEGATFPPTAPANWAVLDNGVGTTVSWAETTNPAFVNSGVKAAIMDRENIGAGNTSQDWLITNQITVPANGQLRFFTRQTLIGNNGSTYEIRVSTNPSQTNQAAFTTLQTWTETTLNTTYNVYEEKAVNLTPTYAAGTQIYIAFVKINTQPTGTTSGDRWLIDDVKVIQQCLDPTILTVGAITPTSASLAWTNNGSATSWEVEVIPAANTPTGVGVAAPTNPFVYNGLTPGTAYKYYVRANCGSGNFSQWVGPFNFVTTPAGSICSSPITIGSLPYSNASNTNLYGDEVDTPQGAGCAGGATNYMQGAEVFYSYTATFTGNITVSMTPTGVSSSLFVYNGCANVGVSCLGGVADATANPRVIPILAVTTGQTYIFVISSSTTPPAGIPYNLIIQQVNCTAPGGLTAANIGTTTADLSWTNPSGATSWEVAIQPAGSSIPTGPGTTAGTNVLYPATGLTAATAYQYWVRADCGGGLFSAWAGPYLFNTGICNAVDKCNYTFRMTDSFGDGWNGAQMEVRQNGVLVATLTGPTAAQGTTPVNVVVGLCQNFPFQLSWTVAGTFPTEVGISVINNFAQTLYTKPAGTGSAPSVLYTASFDCATPACLPPTALTATAITTTGATLGWNGAGATAWDVYVVLNGGPVPTGATVPTYANVSTNPLVVTGLSALTTYQFYVRVVCSPTSNSTWAGPVAFTTLPTCPQPTALTVTAANMTGASLGWTEAGTATQWEVFIQTPPGAGPPTGPGILTSTNPYIATGLTAGTAYEFYVRAVCSPTDSSTWAGPKTFNTTICAPANQCNYTFRMRDTFGDSWNGNIMQVRQNGIVVATLTGPTAAQGTTNVDVLVPICHGVPFELYWSTLSSFPNEVQISIIEPLGATTIYTKPAAVQSAGLLYTDVGQCLPPTCGKPIALTATLITQTTASLGWTQPAAPGAATSWEIIVQPAILGFPTGPGTITSSNPYLATGLTPGTLYEFYVRANCGATDGLSNWAGPFAFGTQVANDECINAIVVPVNDDASCALFGSGSVIGATGSLPATACAGTANDDVWFQFTATSTKHYINLFNVAGSTTDLNHVVYSGTCGAMVQQGACQLNNTSIISGLTIGNVYYVRVYTATATTNQTTTFNICIGTVSNCENAEAFCSNPTTPFIFPNTTGVPSEGQQACLFTNPNPTYYFMTVLQSGNLQFQISQNTSFNAAGNPTGTGLDVDFVAWGPFVSNTAACGNLGNGCPTPANCPNNTTNPTFYPYVPGNIMDCSYSAAAVENFTIANAIAGQVYVVVITNFNGATGFIKLNQTNQGTPGAGATDCSAVCSVNLGPDQSLCGVSSTILNSQLSNPTATFVWKLNGVVIVGANASTYTATVSGVYTCIATCGVNSVSDSMTLNLGPNVIVPDQPDYIICDDASNDGIGTFDLSTLTPLVLTGLDTNYTYNVTYHYTAADALAHISPINPAIPYIGASQTIYISVVANGSTQCNTVVPQNLVVNPTPAATLVSSDADNTICSNDTATITVTPTNFPVAGATYVWTLDTFVIAGATTEQVTVTTTGIYEVTITVNGCTTVLSIPFTVNPVPTGTLTSTDVDNTICSDDTATITFTPINFVTGAETYVWTLNTGLISGATTNQITPTVTGVYEVTVTLNGCSSVYSMLFTINPKPVATLASSDADNIICSNDTATISVVPTNFVLTDATYVWTLNTGVIPGATANQITVTTTGTYEVTINLNGCSTAYSMVFTVNTLPNFTLSGTNLVKCGGEHAIISVVPVNFSLTDPIITYTWTHDAIPMTNTTSSIDVTDFGVYEVTVSNQGCSTTHNVTVIPDNTDIPIGTVGECFGSNYIITASPISGSYDPQTVTYQWYNNTDLSTVIGTQSTLNVTEYVSTNNISAASYPLHFTVKITTVPEGCIGDEVFEVTSSACTIQKGISPNADGLNDFFDLRGLGVKELNIYNRYGTKVYNLANYKDEWKGQSNKGQELPDGTYYYVIDQTSGETKSGWIYINR